MRKLSSVEIIQNIEPIEGADFIVKITILGWNLVAKKDEFKIGDKCVFYQIDSKLKPNETYSFLEKEKYRIKTRRFKNQISQGLALPISILKNEGVLEDGWKYDEEKETIISNLMNIKIVEGIDLTDILGVEKYDLEEGESLEASVRYKLNPKKSKLANKISYWKWKIKLFLKRFDTRSKGGMFPTDLVPKTNQERFQSFSKSEIEEINGKSFTSTIKMDGSSTTLIKNKKDIILCSRNLAIGENSDNKFWKAINKYDLKSKIKSLKGNIALQMELIGESVQGNRYNIRGVDIRLFNVYDIDNKKYLSPKDMIKIANKLEIPHVHIIDDNFILNHTVDELVNMATRKSIDNQKVNEEGIVFWLNDEDKKLSFKVINPEYLLEKEKKK